MLLADELGERARPQACGERCELGCALARRIGEEVAHRRQYAPAVATHEDFSEPILEGEGESDYERYLNTVGLLALQKKPR